MSKKQTILEEAYNIVFERGEEKEREYGPIHASMEKASVIATILCGKEISAEDMYKCMMALKLSRISHCAKRDSMVDLVAYTAALEDLYEQYNEQSEEIDNVFKR